MNYLQKSQWSCNARCVQFHLKKDNDETWSQLLKVLYLKIESDEQDKNQYKNLLKIDWDMWADSDEEEEQGNFNLPPNFESLMANMKDTDMPMDDHCECGHDHCECGHDHCECSSDESSDSEDDMPPLEEAQ